MGLLTGHFFGNSRGQGGVVLRQALVAQGHVGLQRLLWFAAMVSLGLGAKMLGDVTTRCVCDTGVATDKLFPERGERANSFAL
ncbi:hypothetical protein GCM10008997_40420 [Halomonas salifodinae]